VRVESQERKNGRFEVASQKTLNEKLFASLENIRRNKGRPHFTILWSSVLLIPGGGPLQQWVVRVAAVPQELAREIANQHRRTPLNSPLRRFGQGRIQ